MFNFLKLSASKKTEHKNFLDLPARSQKRMIVEAVKRANEMQLALVKEYDRKYGSRKATL